MLISVLMYDDSFKHFFLLFLSTICIFTLFSCCWCLYLLQDENDNPPEFSTPSYVIKIPENIIAGKSIHTFGVTV